MDPRKTFSAMEPAKKAFSLLEEFKNFALKGNLIDLAVGVIIGAAFGAIVKSLVDNIMMPLIGALVSASPAAEEGYKSLGFRINGNVVHTGLFLADVFNFLIVALALFIFIQKFLGFVLHSKKEEAVAPPPPTRDQELLMEIRDLLRQKQSG
ncbi:MAG TPA: large conductance mechanosensitive channel protein MscL [Planctomycetaceae bacterium]|jgi:large conductance mechanosensitive channel|nr:large conductance mechanosensitive channel protein MscL [Planctomycetaceae bacterium]